MTQSFSSEETEIGTLIKNNKFEVPRFQRTYSWKGEANQQRIIGKILIL